MSFDSEVRKVNVLHDDTNFGIGTLAGIDFGRRGTTSHAVVAAIALPYGARVWSRPFHRGRRNRL